MTQRILHRGPDDEGVRGRALGSACGGSASSTSPAGSNRLRMKRATSMSCVTARSTTMPNFGRDLEKRGHRFASGSDTEAIVDLYQEYGDDCLQHLRGMFGLAIWDGRKQRLLIVRDRLARNRCFMHNLAIASIRLGDEVDPGRKPRFEPAGLSHSRSVSAVRLHQTARHDLQRHPSPSRRTFRRLSIRAASASRPYCRRSSSIPTNRSARRSGPSGWTPSWQKPYAFGCKAKFP